jgi:purine-binding chemotaxis protein CheW
MIGRPDFFNENEEELSSELQELESREGELYLRFYVASGDEFALPAVSIREVMQQTPDRITPIPNSSPLLLGTINLRGQVMWVADLGQFLGDSKNLNTQRQEIPIIAIESEDIILGLAIDKLGQMDWRDMEQLEKPSHTAEQMELFVLGEWLINGDDEQVIRLLDHQAILRSARWAA